MVVFDPNNGIKSNKWQTVGLNDQPDCSKCRLCGWESCTMAWLTAVKVNICGREDGDHSDELCDRWEGWRWQEFDWKHRLMLTVAV